MNRRERRAAVARGKTDLTSAPADIPDLTAEAYRAYQQGQAEQAEVICKRILARVPAHKSTLTLLGRINQASGRHRLAVKRFAEAIALNDLDAVCHYDIARSYQILDQQAAAAAHFKRAIALGMGDEKDVEEFVMQNPVIVECVGRIIDGSNLAIKRDALFGAGDIAAIAHDGFLRCALELTIIRGVTLELFLTHLRYTLLQLACGNIHVSAKVADDLTGFFCALAQQCFNNEYVFAQSDEETQQVTRLRDLLAQNLTTGKEIPPLLLAAVAAYFPIHSIANAGSLLAGEWPPHAADLLRQQIREPFDERQDSHTLRVLTSIDDGTSIQVMQQYEENPYPAGRSIGSLP
jgi:hypothetical protein